MFRIIAGIVVGWIVMGMLVMATFGITMLALGWEGTLQPDSYWTTDTFNIIVLIGGLLAAIVGGAMCALIAKSTKAVVALVAIMLVIGIGSAVMNMNKPDPPARTGEPTFEDIATHGKEPTWFAFGKVGTAVVGLLIGASLVPRRDAART
jgi:hypothetical protein